jgi:hypothetical protein
MTGRPTSPDDVWSAEQPIVFVIDDDESMRRFRMLPAVWFPTSGAWIERLGLSTRSRKRRTFM